MPIRTCLPNMLHYSKPLKAVSPNHPHFFPSQAPVPPPSGAANLGTQLTKTLTWQWPSRGLISRPLPPEPDREEGFKADKWQIRGHLIRRHFYLLFPEKYLQYVNFFFFFFKDFTYSFEREREHTCRHKQGSSRGRGRSRLPALSREPDVGLDPRSPRS